MNPKWSHLYEMSRKIHSVQAMPKVWNYLKYRCAKRGSKISIKHFTPQIAALWVTQRCNLNCWFCGASDFVNKKDAGKPGTEATLAKVERIFESPLFSSCLLVDLEGGEPLLVDELGRIVAYLAHKGHLVNTSTNGLLLADRVVELKKAGISRINLSYYDENHAVVERNLEKINRIFPVHMSMLLLRSKVENHQDEILRAAKFFREAGCRSLRFWIYRPMGTDPKPDEIVYDTSQAYMEFQQRIEKELPGFCYWPVAKQGVKIQKRCPRLWQWIGCDMLGNMAICCGTNMLLQGPQSNLFQSDPEALLNHPMFVMMRSQLMDPQSAPPEICKNCNLLGDPGW
ncbi:MAG TPA: radical SAM protein [Candidatus Omnitrophota bacterium]|nr:radical SAM protein [Candidatus Omnitrophota bacterium]